MKLNKRQLIVVRRALARWLQEEKNDMTDATADLSVSYVGLPEYRRDALRRIARAKANIKRIERVQKELAEQTNKESTHADHC